jgi:nucleoside-diphosphate-sugar epimerase
MRFFVTGGTGFIGSHFIKQALTECYEVHAIRRPGSVPRIILPVEPFWHEGSLESNYDDVLKNCNVFVHFAASGVDSIAASWEECFNVNVIQSLSLWRRAVDKGVSRFVICGSCFEYGRSGERYDFIPTDAPLEPTGAYHASKAAATLAAIALGIEKKIEVVILRPFHVYGEGESVRRFWPMLRQAALQGEDFSMTQGQQVRDFTPVEEVAMKFLKYSVTPTFRGEPMIYNVGTGRPQTLLEFGLHWWKTWNASGKLLAGKFPYRKNEVMRYVPKIV